MYWPKSVTDVYPVPRSRKTDYGIPITDYGIRFTEYGLRIFNDGKTVDR
jgi:hypothetical protein